MNINIFELGAVLLAGVFFAIIYFLGKVKKYDFGLLTILGLVFGVAVGLIFKGHYLYLEAIGTIYSHLILAIVIPLLLFSIISSITNLGTSIKLKKISAKAIIFLLLNTLLASTITLTLAVVTKVGSGINYQLASDYKAVEVPAFIDTIINLFPSNLANSWVNGEVVPIVIFAVIVAIAYNKIARNQQKAVLPFKHFIDAGNRVMGEVVNFVISFTPYAVLALIARAVSKSALSDLIPLLSVLGLAYLLSIIQIFGVTSVLLKVVGKLNPLNFFKGIWPVLLAVFAINVLEIDYSIGQYIFLIVLAVVVSIGTVGVPGTATITATALFASAGLPIEIIVLLAPISSIVDMARTATNVVGAASAAMLVARSENELDLAVYNNETIGQPDLEII